MESNEAKVIMLGDIGVGKTAIFNRIVDSTFLPTAKSSIGVDLRIVVKSYN